MLLNECTKVVQQFLHQANVPEYMEQESVVVVVVVVVVEKEMPAFKCPFKESISNLVNLFLTDFLRVFGEMGNERGSSAEKERAERISAEAQCNTAAASAAAKSV